MVCIHHGLRVTFLGCMMLTPGFAHAAIDNLPPDGSLKEIKAEALEAPYSEDDYYAYAKSPSFTRWVYSPWTAPEFKADSGLQVSKVEPRNKKSVLISEFNVGTQHLDASKTYELLLENDYQCGSSPSDTQACSLQFTVRCYGKSETSDWDVTFESSTQRKVTQGSGVFKIAPTSFAANKCQNSLYVSAEATLSPSLDTYTFQGLRVGLKTTAE